MLSLQRFLGCFASLLLILTFIPSISAGPLSAGPQKIVHYYTYRAMIKTHGETQNKMLRNRKYDKLKGTHKDKGLNFCEFENAISNDNIPLSVADYNAAGITDLDNPYRVTMFFPKHKRNESRLQHCSPRH